MKAKILIVILLIFSCITKVSCEKFSYINSDGVELKFSTLDSNHEVALLYYCHNGDSPNPERPNYPNIHIDTLHIPDEVEYEGQKYAVTTLGQLACAYLKDIKVVTIPASVAHIAAYEEGGTVRNTFTWNNLKGILVDNANPYFCSVDGILYTKDLKKLIAYPTSNPVDSVEINEGVEILASTSFWVVQNIKYLELPLSLKKIESWSVGSDKIRHIIIKDSVETLSQESFYNWGQTHLTIGQGVKTVGKNFVNTDSTLHIYCRPIIPPIYSAGADFLSKNILENGTLYVPMRSLSAYQQAPGWSSFQHILPIEPPIVTGLSSAEVSWVQNFSATGYIWTLYLDEAKTQRFMSMTFDAIGHLTNIDFGSNLAPKRAPALYNGEDEENRYAEYYSFTITGLSPDTKYYYTRQSLNGYEVIDEENGSFKTQQAAALSGALQQNGERRTKFIRDGQMYILREGKKYDLTGKVAE